MKYLQSYEFYTINENFDTQLLLEDKNFNLYRTIQDKTIKKLGLNLYFVGTFQMGVTVLYPIVEALVKNSNLPTMITPEQIVLLTVFSIAQILHVANNDVQTIKSELEKDNLLHLVDKVKDSLKSIYKIFGFVARSFGKIIDVFTDMLAYVGLSVPVYMGIVEVISREGLNLDTLPQKILVFSASAGAFALKSFVEIIIEYVKNKVKKS